MGEFEPVPHELVDEQISEVDEETLEGGVHTDASACEIGETDPMMTAAELADHFGYADATSVSNRFSQMKKSGRAVIEPKDYQRTTGRPPTGLYQFSEAARVLEYQDPDRPTGLNTVRTLHGFRGDIRVGTASAWVRERNESRYRLYQALKQLRQHEPDSKPACYRWSGKDVRIWTEVQVDSALELYDQLAEYGYLREWLGKDIPPKRKGSVALWADTLVPPIRKAELRVALRAIQARVLPGSETVGLYNRHGIEAARHHLESFSRGREEVAYNPITGELFASSQAWGFLFDRDPSALTQVFQQGGIQIQDRIGGGPGAPTLRITEAQMASTNLGLFSQPALFTVDSKKFRHPTFGTVYLRPHPTVLARMRGVYSDDFFLTVRNRRVTSSQFVEFSAYCEYLKREPQSLLEGLGNIPEARENYGRDALSRIAALRVEARQCQEAGIQKFTSEGTIEYKGTTIALRSHLIILAEETFGVENHELVMRLVRATRPACQRLVIWETYWKEPILMPLYDLEGFRKAVLEYQGGKIEFEELLTLVHCFDTEVATVQHHGESGRRFARKQMRQRETEQQRRRATIKERKRQAHIRTEKRIQQLQDKLPQDYELVDGEWAKILRPDTKQRTISRLPRLSEQDIAKFGESIIAPVRKWVALSDTFLTESDFIWLEKQPGRSSIQALEVSKIGGRIACWSFEDAKFLAEEKRRLLRNTKKLQE